MGPRQFSIFCHLCNAILQFANLFIKIRQLYQFLSPIRLQIFVSESTLLCIVLFYSKLSQSVILGNMFLVLTIVTSRRCTDYLNHALKSWSH